MSGHTKGPWVAVDVTTKGTAIYRRIDAGRSHVGFAGAYKMKCQKEALANARLIAAAPELLEALDRAVPYLEDAANDCRDAPNDAAHVLDAMMRAIAKAKGEAA